MNEYSTILQDDNLGVTPLENIFINHYLPRARGDYLKVYLYGLKQAYHTSQTTLNNQELAEHLDLTEKDVIKAWEYWAEQGVIAFAYNGEGMSIQFYNITSKLLSGTKAVPQETAEVVKTTAIQADEESRRVEFMYDKVQEMYGSRALTRKDLQQIDCWLTDLGFTPETIILLAEQGLNAITKIEERDGKNFTAAHITKYLNTIANDWYAQGIVDFNQALDYINDSRDKRKLHREVFSYLGLSRQPMTNEREMMNRWQNEFGFDQEMIMAALARTTKPNLNYITGILSRWYEAGYKSPADLDQDAPKQAPVAAHPDADTDERSQAYEALESQEDEYLRSFYDDDES